MFEILEIIWYIGQPWIKLSQIVKSLFRKVHNVSTVTSESTFTLNSSQRKPEVMYPCPVLYVLFLRDER